jgi:hypothetical protein
MEIGFDVISDLRLSPNDNFKWNNKATSLYCIVAGNVSSDTRTIIQTLGHLSKFYLGVFYVPGTLEYQDIVDIEYRTEELGAICSLLDNVAILYRNVAILDGIAIVAINGWGELPEDYQVENIQKLHEREDDYTYLIKSVEKLQRHLDVKKIVVVSSIVPKKELYFGQAPNTDLTPMVPKFHSCLREDTEHKVAHWIFGTYENTVDVTLDNINYVNNSYYARKNYWAKRVLVTI